ncbi:hypothetical protein EDD53_1167 [Pacificibacter maritimus]|uniref:AbiTii domain-containing protein n=1 Tax=Pacificibacter maritimus TaxID=762213 RepID=A0A3N4UPQ5_9RHOB|nr:hypothetical protein [Pacificibacter maritimus]RPE72028.1 hypothetical protein EDD53_1167 [Pacificibacter maritimus]
MSDITTETKLIQSIFASVENDDVSAAFRSCQRLALKLRDFVNFAYFLYEQEHGEQEDFRHLNSSLGDLEKDQLKLIHELALKRKFRTRALDPNTCDILDIAKDSLLMFGCGHITAELERSQALIDSLAIPSNINNVDAAFFYKENELRKLQEIHRRSEIRKIKERLLSAAFNYASLAEQRLIWASQDKTTIDEMEAAIFSFLNQTSPAALKQLQKASGFLHSKDSEERSQASLLIRRSMNSLANAVQPADPKVLGLEQDKPLNRISYYLEEAHKDKTPSLAFRTKDLEKLLHAINSRSSKGVHSAVSTFELQQVYLASLLYLGNIAKVHEAPSMNNSESI